MVFNFLLSKFRSYLFNRPISLTLVKWRLPNLSLFLIRGFSSWLPTKEPWKQAWIMIINFYLPFIGWIKLEICNSIMFSPYPLTWTRCFPLIFELMAVRMKTFTSKSTQVDLLQSVDMINDATSASHSSAITLILK